MPYPLANRLSSSLFSALQMLNLSAQADQDPATEIVIDDGGSGESMEGADIVIDGGEAAEDFEIMIDAGEPDELEGDITIDQASDTPEPQIDPPALAESRGPTGDFRFGLDATRIELGISPTQVQRPRHRSLVT